MKNPSIDTNFAFAILILVASMIGFVFWLDYEKEKPLLEAQTIDPQITLERETGQSLKKITSCNQKNGTYIQIEEMGIEVLVDPSIKEDVIYFTEKDESGSVSASFSTKSIAAMNRECDLERNGEKYEHPLGSISKYPGTPAPESWFAPESGRKVRQLNDFYIGYTGPHAPCAFNEDQTLDTKTQDHIREVKKKMFFLNNVSCIKSLKEISDVTVRS